MSSREVWNREYGRRGIPSSYRDEPSGALVWTLENWKRLTGEDRPGAALDLGCGTGRNTAFLAASGVVAVGVDYSDVALAKASARVAVVLADLGAGFPLRGARFDLVSDLFAYKHMIDKAARSKYRGEVARVLRPDGRWLVSLADVRDDYYAACPDYGTAGVPRCIIDPRAGIASVLFSLEELVSELSDRFTLQMCWLKEKPGMMYGREYRRRTIASIWQVA